MSITPDLYDFVVKVVEDKLKEIKITKGEFDKLSKHIKQLAKNIVDLSERQKQSGETVAKLAEAQKRSEERLTRLEETVAKLAEAQKRSEERLTRLEKAVEKLANSVNNLTREVGSLSATIGFGLEDIARVVVPGWLYRHESIDIDDLKREFFEINGKTYEINLYGIGKKNEKDVVVIGECKTKIRAPSVKRFAKILSDVKELFSGKMIYPLMFAFVIYPDAKEEAQKYGIQLIASYER